MGRQVRGDGLGYPEGLAGELIPLGARIIAVVAAFGGMTTDRPYREACAEPRALAELRRCSGTQLDPAIVDALCHMLIEESGTVGGAQVA